MHADLKPYFQFTYKGRLDRSINSLLGLIEGITIDGTISEGEISLLRMWLEDHHEVANRHPFSELIPVVSEALADGVLSDEEREDIKWLCERLRSGEFFDRVTADLQRLHAIVGGIAGDGEITAQELRGLSDWLGDHEHLKTCWPYDEIGALTTHVLADGRIDAQEHKLLLAFFSEFLALLDDRSITAPLVHEADGLTLGALCAVTPDISFTGKGFCFTGASSKMKRTEFGALVERLGGQAFLGVSSKVDFLVIGAEGNPCWAYACYGRKVEKAVELRKQGVRVVLVHENDFHDAVMGA